MGAAARPAFRAPVWQCVGGRRQVTDLAVCDAGSYEDDGSWSDAEVSFVRPTTHQRSIGHPLVVRTLKPVDHQKTGFRCLSCPYGQNLYP